MTKNTLNRLLASLLVCSVLPGTVNAQQNRAERYSPFIHSQRPVTDALSMQRPPQLPTRTANRSVNGTNNNISSTDKLAWGSADIPLFREIPPAYGASDPKNAMNGSSRPSPRKISNAVIDEPVTTFNNRNLSAFVYVWGQFIDHDMSLTPTGTTEAAPIPLPADETIFTEAIPFDRSEVRAGTGTTNARQQSNLNTSWLDASMVYGGEATRAKWLRTFKGGKLKTSAGNFLPWNTISGEQAAAIDINAPTMANDNNHTVKTFVAGDIRAAEHPGILSLHTIFVREHNRICDRLFAQGYRNDEDIYQRARKEVGALIQAVTYQEFLPALGITLRPYFGYNQNVRPDIMNSFATAGYRLGHTMVADDIMLIDNNCGEVGPGELDLLEAFWMPDLVVTYSIDPFLKGLAVHTQYETDTKINSILRNFLFVSPNDPVRFGIDLGSLNIQRGRDHGLPDFNTVRRYYTGHPATRFSDITTNTVLADSLSRLYGNVNNIDLWVGILAEDHLPGKSVGRTVHEMLRVQFENLRDGDFYFYKNDPYLPLITKLQLVYTKLSDVIKRNSSLTNIQSNVFFTDPCTETPPAAGKQSHEEFAATAFDVNKAITIYPNPAQDVLNIYTAKSANYTIRIIAASGNIVKNVSMNGKDLKLNVSGIAKGSYMVSITSGNTIENRKFIKL